MGSDNWNHSKFLQHKVRNIMRRGYLVKTYYDKKILQARIKTGDGIENDRLDWLHPVGFVGRVKNDDKVEILNQDVGGDPSRRVVTAVIGDREHHPKVDEGESILYSPGDIKKHIRVRKGKEGGGGNPNARAGDNEKPGGIEIEGDDVPISTKTKKNISTESSEEGISTKSKKNVTTDAGEAIVQKAVKGMSRKSEGGHNFDGDVRIKGNLYISGQGFKPGDGPWAAGSPRDAELPTYEGEMVGVPDEGYLPSLSLDPDGTVVFRRPVRFEGPVTFGHDVMINGELILRGQKL